MKKIGYSLLFVCSLSFGRGGRAPTLSNPATEAAVQELFEEAKNSDSLINYHFEDGCWGRSAAISEAVKHYGSGKIWVLSTRRGSLIANPIWLADFNKTKYVSRRPDQKLSPIYWAFHVATWIYYTNSDGTFSLRVLDPTLGINDKSPPTIPQWLSKFVLDKSDVTVALASNDIGSYKLFESTQYDLSLSPEQEELFFQGQTPPNLKWITETGSANTDDLFKKHPLIYRTYYEISQFRKHILSGQARINTEPTILEVQPSSDQVVLWDPAGWYAVNGDPKWYPIPTDKYEREKLLESYNRSR